MGFLPHVLLSLSIKGLWVSERGGNNVAFVQLQWYTSALKRTSHFQLECFHSFADTEMSNLEEGHENRIVSLNVITWNHFPHKNECYERRIRSEELLKKGKKPTPAPQSPSFGGRRELPAQAIPGGDAVQIGWWDPLPPIIYIDL